MSGSIVEYAEGQTPLDPDEIHGLRIDWVTTRASLDDVEHENIQKGIDWAARAVRRRALLADDFLRELHRRMFGDVWTWAGRYRTSEKNIGVAPHRIAECVRNLVEDAQIWMADDVYVVDERVARFHHRLVAIHPFPNGNGRFSRAAADLLMRQTGAAPLTWGMGLDAFEARSRYIAALRAADAGAIERLVGFVRL
jgi:Fic-DOC domain mobile mystery protein B